MVSVVTTYRNHMNRGKLRHQENVNNRVNMVIKVTIVTIETLVV
jgi:hypothetical protein